MEHVGGFPASSRLVGQRVLGTRAVHNRARVAHGRDRRQPARRSAPWCGTYPHCALAARPMKPLDPLLGGITTVGAAFIAMQATKEAAASSLAGSWTGKSAAKNCNPSNRTLAV